jgi:glycosyltransferase involved in cell wall biosynthesis
VAEPATAVIVPALDEAGTVGDVLREYHAVLPGAELVVVDNGSSDGTGEVAEAALVELGCPGRVLREPRPGKGIAVRTALRAVQADLYVLVDADSTYPASSLPPLLEAVRDGGADMAVGDRHAGGAYARQNARPLHGFGNALVTRLINILYRSSVRDVMSGLRVFNRTVARSVPLLHDGFEIETEMTVYCLDRRLRIVEHPIEYRARPEGSRSKLRTTRDGARILRLILLLFKDYRPLAFFGRVGAAAILLGIVAGIPPILDYVQYQYVYRVPLAVLAVGLVLTGVVAVTTGVILDTVVNLDRQNFERQIRE